MIIPGGEGEVKSLRLYYWRPGWTLTRKNCEIKRGINPKFKDNQRQRYEDQRQKETKNDKR